MTQTYRVSGQLNGRKAYATESAHVSDHPRDAFTGTRDETDAIARAMMAQHTHYTRTGAAFNGCTVGWMVEEAR